MQNAEAPDSDSLTLTAVDDPDDTVGRAHHLSLHALIATEQLQFFRGRRRPHIVTVM
jgi:hypothetical protein